ncbi:hypothetical protein GPALN_014506 [Globodera pallida]|nr:hypothetical protein GPALN_014506 [Globodera pallida]
MIEKSLVSCWRNVPLAYNGERAGNRGAGAREALSRVTRGLLPESRPTYWPPSIVERGGCQPQQQNGVGETVNEEGVRANIADDGEQSRVVEDEEVVEPQKHPLPADAGVVAAVPEPAHGNNGEEEQYEIEKIYAVYTHNGNGNNNNTTHGVLTT